LYSELRCAPVDGTSVDNANSTDLILEDGGGPGSISQLLFMKELLRRIEFDLDLDEDTLRPSDYWDLMGGVGFGGCISSLKAYLELILPSGFVRSCLVVSICP
jgi:hypothetical protein